MPRPRLRAVPADPFDELLAELDAGRDRDPFRPLHDPPAALELVRAGGLDDDQRERLRVRALEAIRHAEWTDHLEEIGALVTSPPAAAAGMRARREANAAAWRRVLDALGSSDAA